MATAKWDNQDGRLRGRKLQARRLRVWKAKPYCAMCKRLVDFPSGFQLDHIKAVHKHGEDLDDSAVQVLCCLPDGSGGCHAIKTAKDMGYRERIEFDKEGRVKW